ncbi:MAG: M23 family metallopeptidase [Bacteroidota bacterium]
MDKPFFHTSIISAANGGAGLLLFVALLVTVGCKVSNNPLRKTLRSLQNGSTTDDTSYVYRLPYDSNTSHVVVQGYFSPYSHNDRAAIDFKMKRGTRILAARSGVVIKTKSDGTRGGAKMKYRADGNHIIIQHGNEARSSYWHLETNGIKVNVGDTVQEGQFIGLSGKTGYALFPHLHFSVSRNDGSNGSWMQTGCRFRTSKGIVYLRPFRRYSL